MDTQNNDNANQQAFNQEDVDLKLNFEEANFGSNTSLNLNNFNTNGVLGDESSLMLDLTTPPNNSSTPTHNFNTAKVNVTKQNSETSINPKLLR